MTPSSTEGLEELERDLAESRAREATEVAASSAYQRAVGEVLRAMAKTPGDPVRVSELLLEHAMALSGAALGVVSAYDGETIYPLAQRDPTAKEDANTARDESARPHKADPTTLIGRAVLERRIVQSTRAGGFYASDPTWQADTTGRVGRGIALPLMRATQCIGAFALAFAAESEIPPRLVDLLRTFADQATLVIENAHRVEETHQAIERQEATAAVLRVISNSRTDTHSVIEKILDSCQVLFGVENIAISRIEADGQIHSVAGRGVVVDVTSKMLPRPAEGTATGLAIRERRTIHIPNAAALEGSYAPFVTSVIDIIGDSSNVVSPLFADGVGIGALWLARVPPKPFTDREIALLTTFADQAAIAIENARLFHETQQALEHQTATADILKVISSSPTDVQPVFQAIAEHARKLCNAKVATTSQFDGELMHILGIAGAPLEGETAIRAAFPLKPDSSSFHGRVVLSRRVLHIADAFSDAGIHSRAEAVYQLAGFRSALVVPMMRGDEVVGVIGVHAEAPGLFPAPLVTLLQTFADQAVIAIENVRLFNETRAALDLQTATSQVLQVISTSMADAQPVYEAILDKSTQLVDANTIGIFVAHDGEVHNVGFRGDEVGERMIRTVWPMPVSQSMYSQIVVEKRVINTENVGVGLAERPLTQRLGHEIIGDHSVVIAPIFWEGRMIGAICAWRYPPRPFSDQEASSLAGFAEQAGVAIQNARLFNDTKEALEQQTATAEVLKVISTSVANAQPVYEKILDSTEKLIDGDWHTLFRIQDGQTQVVATRGGEAAQRFASAFPISAEHTTVSRAGLHSPTTHIPDSSALADPPLIVQKVTQALGAFSGITAPLLWEGQWIGGLSVGRVPPCPFTDKERALLRTFADQAVIAFQNTQLFNDTKGALAQQTAISDVLRVTTESPNDVEPVLNVIADHAVHLCDAAAASIFLVEDNQLRHVCSRGPLAEQAVALELLPIDRRSTSGVAILDSVTVEVADIQAEPAKYPLGAETARRLGHRSMAVTPLLREGKAFGTLLIRRQEVRPFNDREVALLKTFGSQAAIALESVRLFIETREALEQQTATSEVLKIISSSVANAQPVFEKILDSCRTLFGVDTLAIMIVRDGQLYLEASRGEVFDAARTMFPQPVGKTLTGRAIIERRTIYAPSAKTMFREQWGPTMRAAFEVLGDYSSVLAPLLKDNKGIGSIAICRAPPKPFSEKEIVLLTTFADQAVIAIENERLFQEIESKSRQLEVASRHKSQFLASMSHELRTPLNAILGFNEMILDEIYGEVPPDMREPLRDIQDSGKHLLRLINNVLDLAKIEAGRMELALAEYAAHDLVESVRATLWPLATAKGLELRATLPDELPLAYGDPGRLTQCLMNLASNSLKFSSVGRVEISIALQGDTLVFRVTDTGIGIPADKLDSLFTEFKQTDATIASEYGGTGLGLSISRKFVEMHGGRIWVESEVGRGSVFSFEVPLRVAQVAA